MFSLTFPRRASLVLFLLAFSSVVIAQDNRASGSDGGRVMMSGPLNTTSPFQPPTANDHTFVINSGPGLDTGCTFRSGGPLRITLPIGRVLGDLAILKDKKLVPEKVRLEFPAFDVDSTVTGLPPERDRVTFIGKGGVAHVVPGQYMSGLNDTWIMQRFDIPIDWLNLPDEPASQNGTVTPLNNEIRIDIDTASGTAENWCTAIDWVSITIVNPIPPRPWIGAHGIFSESGIWNGLWVKKIREFGIPAAAGPDMGRLDSIQSNAGKIGSAVAQARARWGVDRVNIVAHSKGGLDSRHYIENNKTVENLVQLGTPNAGSPLADSIQSNSIRLFGLFGNIAANLLAGGVGGYQLTTTHMAVYNTFHGSNPKVKYMAIAGHQQPGNWLQDPGGRLLQSIVGPGDLIVPVSSVHALPYTSNRTVTSTYPPTFGPASHTELHTNQMAFDQAKPLILAPGLSKMAPSPTGAMALVDEMFRAIAGPAAGSPALQHAQSFGGRLQQPQTADHVIAVDAASTLSFTLFHPEGDLDLKLTDPNGQVFDATTVAGRTDVSRQQLEIPGGFLEVYGFTGPFTPGNWTATVTAVNSSAPVDYSLTAWLEDAPLQMSAAADKASAPVGGSFVLTAALANGSLPVTGATVQAAILLPNGTTSQTVTLADNGAAPDAAANDGVYSGLFNGTTQAGVYGMAVYASGTVGGAPFTRETYMAVYATASNSKILAGLNDFGRDTNANGKFDQLVLEVPVQISAAGTYRLAATLEDSAGNVLETSNAFALTTASTRVELLFDGTTLFARGINGPYKVTSVRMAEEASERTLPLPTAAPSVHHTKSYLYMQFEGAGLLLTGTNTAVGVDTNANGKFDLLRVDIGVNVPTAGFYQWSGRLRDKNGREITLANGSATLVSGVNTIRLNFNGAAVGANGVDGPFYVTDLLLFSTQDTLSVADVFATSALFASSFEGFTAPTMSVADGAVTEGTGGTTNAVINVTLSAAPPGPVTVQYQTADGTAAAGQDYQPALGTLTFNAGETSKSVTVVVNADETDETDETFLLRLSAATNAALADAEAAVTIADDDAPPPAAAADLSVTEGDSGTVGVAFTVALPVASARAVTINYATADGTATAGSDYTPASGTLTFAPGETAKAVVVQVSGDTGNEPDETFFLNLTAGSNAAVGDAQAVAAIVNDDTPVVKFASAGYTVGEGDGRAEITVTRAGDTSGPATVSYSTSDDSSTGASDFISTFGALRFAAGETSKSFTVFIVDDRYDDDGEGFTVTLSSPVQTTLGPQSTVTVSITDNDASTTFSPVRAQNFNSAFFVRQHYLDFLNREPDAAGLAFWSNQIDECGTDTLCADSRRTNVSAAFFLSIEFQETGYLVYRTHQAAFDTRELLPFRDFMRDAQQMGRGVVIGQPGADALLEANKVAFFDEFVGRAEFLGRYPLSMSNHDYVTALNANAGNSLTAAERAALLAGLNNSTETRATVLRKVAENRAFTDSHVNRAFVYMQYVGYLRRQPDGAGFDFWLRKLLDHNGNYISSEMVRSFIVSGEYLSRFGQP